MDAPRRPGRFHPSAPRRSTSAADECADTPAMQNSGVDCSHSRKKTGAGWPHYPAGPTVYVADGAANAARAAFTLGFLSLAMGLGCFQMGVHSILSVEFVELVIAAHCPLLSV